MICEVLRSFPGPGGMLRAGQEVDTSTWLHTDQLIAQRYIRRKSSKVKPVDSRVAAAREATNLTAAPKKKKIVR